MGKSMSKLQPGCLRTGSPYCKGSAPLRHPPVLAAAPMSAGMRHCQAFGLSLIPETRQRLGEGKEKKGESGKE